MSISRNLIRLCEEIESGRPFSSRSGKSGVDDMLDLPAPMSGMSEEPMDAPVDDIGMDSPMDAMGDDLGGFGDMGSTPMEMDSELDDNSNATVTVATPKGTSVTVTEKMRRANRMRRMSEGFFKTNKDIENFYAGDDILTVMRKREESGWMNEADEDAQDGTASVTGETDSEVSMTTASGTDGRKVVGTVSDQAGNEFDIDGILSFSGEDFEIEDVNLNAASTAGEEATDDGEQDAQGEDQGDGLQKDENDEVTFAERFCRKDEAKSLITRDPIGDMLAARTSNREVKPHGDKTYREPVKRVHDNSLNNKKEIDIKKMNIVRQGLSDLRDGKYQSKTATD